MEIASYRRAEEKLQEVFAYAESIGVPLNVTRFGSYRKALRALVHWQQRKEGRESLPGPDRSYIGPLIEVVELSMALPFFHTCRPDVIREKLKWISTGPADSLDEDAASGNRARNTVFELSLASRLWQAGLKPDVGDNPDVICEVDGKRLVFECKRPFSGLQVGKRIREAADQIRTILDQQVPGTRGIIAISLSKVFSPGNLRLYARNESEMKRELSRQTRNLAERYERTWSRYAQSNIIGILFHLIVPAKDRSRDLYVVAQQWFMYNLVPISTRDGRLIEALNRKFQRLAY